MIIHVVQPGDTLYSIAITYSVTVSKLVQDNGLENLDYLVTGQTIVILQSDQTYIVRQGDTLAGIADVHGISLIQLLRNNPFLTDRDFIYPGEVLTISYDNKISDIQTYGYTYPFIDRNVLRKTLPYLTYLGIFNYRATMGGGVADFGTNDTEAIQMSRAFGVPPIMFITTLSSVGEPNLDIAFDILTKHESQIHHIDSILEIMKSKGYYGVNISFQYFNTTNLLMYEDFLANVTSRLNSEGYLVFVTVNPKLNFSDDTVTFEMVDYTRIGLLANTLILLAYDWAYTLSPPVPLSTRKLRVFLDYITAQVPANKIMIGLPVIGYDWELPFIPGTTKAHALSTEAALQLARDTGSAIQYDENSEAPYFYYNDPFTGNEHVVWFKDARSVNAYADLVPEYNFQGISIWNIMQFFNQLWLIINSQFEIQTLPVTDLLP